MRPEKLFIFLLLSIPALHSSAQDARSMLQAVLSKYENLSMYYVEGTRESTRWTKRNTIGSRSISLSLRRPASGTTMTSRHQIDGISSSLMALQTTEWTFQPWRNPHSRPEWRCRCGFGIAGRVFPRMATQRGREHTNWPTL